MPDCNIIQGLWVGKRLTIMERLSIASFIEHGHEYHLYAYDDVANVPSGTVLRDANEILPKKQVFEDKDLSYSYANFSDVFRYKLLFEKGGFWVDLDTICLRPFKFQSNYVFAQQKDHDGSIIVCGGVIKTPKGCEIMQHCYEKSLAKSSSKYIWWELGPPLLNEAVKKFELTRYVLSYKTFVPINWMDWRDVIGNELLTRIKLKLKLRQKEVYAVHLWNAMWRWEKVDKESIYHPNSLYEKLKKMYLHSS